MTSTSCDERRAMLELKQRTSVHNIRAAWNGTMCCLFLAGSPRGGVVLDPFGGAGTTGLVAARHGRDAILVELNPEYAAMAEKRIHGDAPLFSEVAA